VHAADCSNKYTFIQNGTTMTLRSTTLVPEVHSECVLPLFTTISTSHEVLRPEYYSCNHLNKVPTFYASQEKKKKKK